MPSVHALHQIATASVNMVYSCYLSIRLTQSKVNSCFFSRAALGLGFGSSFDPHWHERLDSLIRKHLLAAWLAVMALHEANQPRSSHYPQWHCGPKLHLLVTNDILHLLDKHSARSPQRAHPHLSGQRSAVPPKQKKSKTNLKHFLKWFLKGKLLAPKLRKSADKWATPIRFTIFSCKKQ